MRTLKLLLWCMPLVVLADADDDKRLADSSTVLNEIMAADDKAVPKDLFAKASCAVVIPSMKKAGFVVAGKYGRGFATCRLKSGGWSAPYAMRIEGGSVGFQIGGSATDVVMLVMNEKGMAKLLTDKFTLGGEASVAAGPVGRESTAMTDAMMTAEILSWSRSKGVFAGVSLQGSTLRPDEDANKHFYGADARGETVLTGKTKVPNAGTGFVATVKKYGGTHKSK